MLYDPNVLARYLASRRQKLALSQVGVVIVGLLCMGYGLHSIVQRQTAMHGSHITIQSVQAVTHTTTQPSETPPAPEYRVASDMPRSVSVASLGLTAFVQKVGVDQHGAIAAPNNVTMAGWYEASAKPGFAGVSIIDGHSQGRYREGVFKKLGTVRAGDTVTVEYGDKSVRTFRVMSVTTMPAALTDAEQYVQLPDVQSQLTLITCAGPYDRATSSYSQRTIVRASLVTS